MTTRARHVLERRFRQWATGKALSAFSAAALLGLTLASEPANAQETLCNEGYGGPSVTVLINGIEVARRTFDGEFGFTDAQGRKAINLGGPYTDGTARFTIFDDTDVARVFVDQGRGGTDLLVVTDILVTADFPAGAPAQTLSLVPNSEASFGSCPGGLHTFGATMDGAVLTDNPASVVEVTAEVFVRGAEGALAINRIAGEDDLGPSMIAPPFVPIGGFNDAVTEDLRCGSAEEEIPCRFGLRNTITFTFANPSEVIQSAGSFAAAVVEQAGGDMGSVLLAATGVGFDRLNAKVTAQPRRNTFKVGAVFELGDLSGGINPPNESFSLRLGGFATTLPPGSFVERRGRRHTFYTFNGVINGELFKARITRGVGKTFSLVASGHGANLTEEMAFVHVAIGDDKGSTAARVFFKGRIGRNAEDGDDDEEDD